MGLAYSNASQQAAVMMGLGVEGFARRGSCPGSFGLSGGFSAHPLLADGCTGQLDAALLEQLGYGATANMQLGGVPTQWVSDVVGRSSDVLCCSGLPEEVGAAHA